MKAKLSFETKFKNDVYKTEISLRTNNIMIYLHNKLIHTRTIDEFKKNVAMSDTSLFRYIYDDALEATEGLDHLLSKA